MLSAARRLTTVRAMASAPLFFLDEFALRQFNDKTYQGTRITGIEPDAFAEEVNRLCSDESKLVDGYAPFCKHVFVKNFVGAKVPAVKLTKENEHLVRSEYKARTEKELPVLTRYIPIDKYEPKEAAHLDIILYSREQVMAEHEALGNSLDIPDRPWGIISIKAQDEDYETPMQPITIMRNALGKDQGGSGVPLEREKYNASVSYWSQHVPLA